MSDQQERVVEIDLDDAVNGGDFEGDAAALEAALTAAEEKAATDELYGVDSNDEAPEPEAKANEPEPKPEPKQEADKSELTQALNGGDEPNIDGVLLKDGKKVLPYDVLSDARKQASEFKQQAKTLQAELDALKSQATDEQKDALDDPDFDPDDYDPALAARLKKVDALEAKLKAIDDEREAAKAVTQQEQDDLVQADHAAAIETTPLLKKLQADDTPDKPNPLFQQAIRISDEIESAFKSQGKSFTRTELYQATEQQLKARIAEMTGQPVNQPQQKALPGEGDMPLPSSISNLPGGTSPKTSERDAVLETDPMKVQAMLMKMSPAEQDEWAERNGF